MDAAATQFLMFIVTVYALLGDDLRLAYAPKSWDDTFTILTTISLILFVLELTLASIGYPDYLGRFFFWLDLVSSLSLVTDIEPIMDWLLGSSNSVDLSMDEDPNQQSSGDSGSASLARASRGARLGTKAGRISRVVRLIRLIRIIKLYKSAKKQMDKKD